MVLGLILFVVFLALVVALHALGRHRHLPAMGTNEWILLQQGLPHSLADDPALRNYLQRTKLWRALGVAGAVAGMVAWTASGIGGGRSVNVMVALWIGWFGAGILPELFVRNRTGTTLRAATLEPRAVDRYVTPSARRWLVGSLVVLGAAIIARQFATGYSVPTRRDLWTTVAACAALCAVSIAALARIAKRPQPADDASDLIVDDAIRTLATTRAVSGWSVLMFIASNFCTPRGGSMRGPWPSVSAAILVAGVIGAIASWAWVPTRISRQRQPVPA